MRKLLWLSLSVLGCASLSQTSGQSGMSSNTSGTSNSSAQSSNGSNASSGASAQSSAASNQSSANSSGSGQSSAQSSVQTGGSSTNVSSTVVVGSALLLGVAGGIITTVYTANHRREARLQQEQLRQLQQAPVPQPMPYKVEPIPLEPGIPQPQPQPQPPPGFVPAPYPKSSREAEPASLDAMVLARSWLMANELQLKQDLALGAGPTIDDLAGIAGISASHREHFGRVLQQHRELLLAPHELTPQQAAQVMAHVGELVMADPLLRPDGMAGLVSR